MSKTQITISIYEMNLNYIIIKLSRPLEALNKSDITLLLNQQNYNDFSFEMLSFGELYKITPNAPFTPYSQVTIAINNNSFYSNMLTPFYSKKYINNTSDYYVRIPENLSPGIYKMKLLYMNDVPLTIQSTEIVISRPINPNYCNVTPNKLTPYSVNETIILTLTLKDILNQSIPDGLYEIEITSKKL